MASKMASLRLKKEYRKIHKSPPAGILARPVSGNILEWHYVLEGPAGSPYEGGFYHGKLIFPPEYPLKPPRIIMLTPSGRFSPGVRLCLSMSDFHPETWNPIWSTSTVLIGLLSFMLESASTVGSINTSDHTKREFARKSLAYNATHSAKFRKLFPKLAKRGLGAASAMGITSGSKRNRNLRRGSGGGADTGKVGAARGNEAINLNPAVVCKGIAHVVIPLIVVPLLAWHFGVFGNSIHSLD